VSQLRALYITGEERESEGGSEETSKRQYPHVTEALNPSLRWE